MSSKQEKNQVNKTNDLTLGVDVNTNNISIVIKNDITNKIEDAFSIEYPSDESGADKATLNQKRRQKRQERRQNERKKLRKRNLEKIFSEYIDINEANRYDSNQYSFWKSAKEAAEQRVTIEEMFRSLMKICKKRGVVLDRSAMKGKKAKTELGPVKKSIASFEELFNQSGAKTIAEYNFRFFKRANHNEDHYILRDNHLIKKQMYSREQAMKDVNLILKTQAQYYDFLTEEKCKEIYDEIFFSRKLKSQKHTIKKCSFEKKKRVTRRCSVLFQEYRIWTKLSMVRIIDDEGNETSLRIEQKNLLANYLNDKKDITKTKMYKLLDLDPEVYDFNDVFVDNKIKGNTTNYELKKIFKAEFFENLTEEKKLDLLNLYFSADDKVIANILEKDYGVKDKITIFAFLENAAFEENYANVSEKAIKKILPKLKKGLDLTTACMELGNNYSKAITLLNETNLEELSPEELDKLKLSEELKSGNPEVDTRSANFFKVLKALYKKHGKFSNIRIEMARQVGMSNSEAEDYKKECDKRFRLTNKYRMFLEGFLNGRVTNNNIKRFKLFLELPTVSGEKFEESIQNLILKEKFEDKNDRIKAKADIDRYYTTPRVLLYNGRIVSLSEIFTREIEVEHIVPYTRSINDSFNNLTLCDREFNDIKDNRLIYEVIGNNRQLFSDFKKRIKSLNKSKKKMLLLKSIPEDFASNSLNNTSHIAKKFRAISQMFAQRTSVTNGEITNALRNKWSLDSIIYPPNANMQGKNRGNLMHHIIDAAVIAYTTDGIIRRISEVRRRTRQDRQLGIELPFPYAAFKTDLTKIVSETFVSYQFKKKLIVYRKNKYYGSLAKNKTEQRSLTIRGSMHEDTKYGTIDIRKGENVETVSTIRKAISSLTIPGISKIIDLEIKAKIMDGFNRVLLEDNKKIKTPYFLVERMTIGDKTKVLIAEENKEFFEKESEENQKYVTGMSLNKQKAIFSKIYEDGIYPKTYNDESENRKVNSVVVMSRILIDKMKVIENEDGTTRMVAPSNNYCIGVYVNEKTQERQFVNLTFFDAVKRKTQGQLLFEPVLGDKKYESFITHNDMFVKYNENKEEIDWNNKADISRRLYRVKKFDQNGNVTLERHNLSMKALSEYKEFYQTGDGFPIIINTVEKNFKFVKVNVSLFGELSCSEMAEVEKGSDNKKGKYKQREQGFKKEKNNVKVIVNDEL
jgi:CRISPR-associated endonuclease Csn1